MKTLEIIHLRLAGNSPLNLMDLVHEALGSEKDSANIQLYHHPKLSNDFAVHIHRKDEEHDDNPSSIGLAIATLLKDYGMVSHSVWVECCRLDKWSKPDETG